MGQCPSSFTQAGNGCVPQCPVSKNFENDIVGGQPRCVYKADRTKFVRLNTVGFAGQVRSGVPPPTLESLKTSNPGMYEQYSAEVTRMNEGVNVILANIDKEKKITDAFVALQAAENARDTAPVSYQQARTNYYTLVKGDTWKQEEQERIAKAEIDPEIRRIRTNIADAQRRKDQQQKTIDVIKGLQDRVLSIKDDFKYSVDTFQRQLGKLKDQMVYDRRKREEESNQSKWELFDRVLNYLIVAALLFAAWKIYTLYFSKPGAVEAPAVGTPAPSL